MKTSFVTNLTTAAALLTLLALRATSAMAGTIYQTPGTGYDILPASVSGANFVTDKFSLANSSDLTSISFEGVNTSTKSTLSSIDWSISSSIGGPALYSGEATSFTVSDLTVVPIIKQTIGIDTFSTGNSDDFLSANTNYFLTLTGATSSNKQSVYWASDLSSPASEVGVENGRELQYVGQSYSLGGAPAPEASSLVTMAVALLGLTAFGGISLARRKNQPTA